MPARRKNRDFNPNNCPVTHCLNRIGGKWKIMIMYAISLKCNRFSLIKKAMPDISKQTLVNQLRELEEDKILERISNKRALPHIEYKITKYGESLIPVINTMQEWGLKDLKKVGGVRMANAK